jgi:hypothetical protein
MALRKHYAQIVTTGNSHKRLAKAIPESRMPSWATRNSGAGAMHMVRYMFTKDSLSLPDFDDERECNPGQRVLSSRATILPGTLPGYARPETIPIGPIYAEEVNARCREKNHREKTRQRVQSSFCEPRAAFCAALRKNGAILPAMEFLSWN